MTPNTPTPVNLLGLDRQGLQDFFATLGEKPFRGLQVMQWLHQYGVDNFDAMTNLSKALRTSLVDAAIIAGPTVKLDQLAADGTRKWLFEMADGNCIETVFIPEEGRGTLCISSQVGCGLNCTFCSTGSQGFNRDLTAAEIIGQVWQANRLLGGRGQANRVITNIVFMGMGEPLLNFDNVLTAIRVLLDDMSYGLSRRRVTVSTAGLVPWIDKLREEVSVSLAVSLHAPNDKLRTEIVPLNKKYPIAELLDACRRYIANDPHRRVTFEYVMLDGVNDTVTHARELVALLHDVPSKVNLIPFNPFPHTGYKRSSKKAIDAFRDIVMQAGLMTITRRTRGDDIDAACGQLAGRIQDRTGRRVRWLARATGE
ncbi:MAG: 23S rRNA (adenine(2503)-C(2))-methyltransferase RlmN [Gammaproteobacteria bacterium]|nr:23S rRNA (adenine(2503)-C(2))-methyltransferase RlmN [Gammaproteobacteria bacterium]